MSRHLWRRHTSRRPRGKATTSSAAAQLPIPWQWQRYRSGRGAVASGGWLRSALGTEQLLLPAAVVRAALCLQACQLAALPYTL